MTVDGKPLTCWGRRMCTVRTRTRECLWTFLLAPVAFPVLGADFLSNFRLLVDSSNKRQVARGCKLIQLEQGKWTKVSLVTGVVAAAPPPALTPSSPSPHTVEALPSTPSLPTVEGGQEAQGSFEGVLVATAPPTAVAPSSPSLPTVEAPGSDSSGQPAARQHIGAAKKLPGLGICPSVS